LTGSTGHQYLVEESTSLGPNASWSFTENILLTSSPQTVLEFAVRGGASSKFYRARFIQ
jgi:hypothetical protein